MIPSLLLVPLLALLLVPVFPGRKRLIAVIVTGTNLFMSAVVTGQVLGGETLLWTLGNPASSIAVTFRADGLAVLFHLTIAVSALGAVAYATDFRWRRSREESASLPDAFWPLWLLLLIGVNVAFFSANLGGLFVGLEAVGAAAVGMAAMAGGSRRLRRAQRYFFLRIPGTLGFFFATALLYTAFGTMELHVLRESLDRGALAAAAAAMLLIGVIVKGALFPLHFWLPPAHSGALGPSSAVLSAIVVKVPFFVALRLWFDLFPDVATPQAGQLIGVLAAAGVIWGGAMALRARRLKLIIAHSTVSQMGYMFLLFPLLTGAAAGSWEIAAWTGGIYQAMSHVMAKAALLMAAGTVLYSIGSDRLRDMHGIAGRLPVTTFAVALSCITLIGLPPSGGFIAKWLLLSAALESGQWWWVPVLLVGALLTAGYAFLMLSYAFQPPGGKIEMRRPPRVMEVVPLLLALASVIIGFRVQEPMRLIESSTPVAIEEEVAQ